MNRIAHTAIRVMAGAFLWAVGAGAGQPDSASAVREGAQLARRVAVLRQERRMWLRATALSSEMALFDEGAALGRSVSVPIDDKGAIGSPTITRGPEVVVQRETTTGLGEATRAPSAGDMEGIEAEIRTIEARLLAVKKGAQKP